MHYQEDKISATLSPSKKLSVGSVEIWNEENQYGQIPSGSTASVTQMQNTGTCYCMEKKMMLR